MKIKSLKKKITHSPHTHTYTPHTHDDENTEEGSVEHKFKNTHIIKDGQPLSSGAQQRLLMLLLLQLSPEMLLFGRLQAHSDHFRTSQHLPGRRSLKLWGWMRDGCLEVRCAAAVTVTARMGGQVETGKICATFCLRFCAVSAAPPAVESVIGSLYFLCASGTTTTTAAATATTTTTHEKMQHLLGKTRFPPPMFFVYLFIYLFIAEECSAQRSY